MAKLTPSQRKTIDRNLPAFLETEAIYKEVRAKREREKAEYQRYLVRNMAGVWLPSEYEMAVTNGEGFQRRH